MKLKTILIIGLILGVLVIIFGGGESANLPGLLSGLAGCLFVIWLCTLGIKFLYNKQKNKKK